MANARFIASLIAAGAALVTSAPAVAGPIEGQVYDAATGAPAPGVRITIVYDGNDFEAGQVVPDTELGPEQQGQITGSDGRYRFDVSGPRFYQLQLDTAATNFSAPSSVVPPRPGLAPLGDVVDRSTPVPPSNGAADRSYYLRFEIPDADARVSNNHIAVDRLADLVTLDARADRTEVTTGDVVYYTLTVTNRSARDLTAAAGTALYVSDAPPRGFSYVKGRAVVQVSLGGDKTTEKVGDDREDYQRRLVRFGPFDLPAGAVMVLRYAVVVGGDTRPGHYTNRAIAADAAGSALSNEAQARVDVTGDDALDTGVILGRVYCDDNGNETFDAGERGVMGARVYVDTGSYAVTDSAGLYHLSNVGGGTRLIKLDEATLGGGAVIGEAAHTLRLTDGLSAKHSFPATCVTVGIDGHHENVVVVGADGVLAGGPAKPAGVELSGSTASQTITVGDRRIELPTAALQLAGDRNLRPVPDGGYGAAAVSWAPSWRAPDGVGVARWTLVISRLDAGDAPTSVRSISGTGALPPSIPWDGLGDDGSPVARDAVYAAQLIVVGDGRDAEAASPFVPFGVDYGRVATGPSTATWTGALFGGPDDAPTAQALLETRVAELAAGLGAGDKLEIAVHWDGTGDEIATIARTQREARLVVSLLVAAGVAEDAITARGRGSLEPLDTSNTPAAREANRRVVVAITPAPSDTAGKSIPAQVGVPSVALIDGLTVTLDGGAFAMDLPPDASVVVDVTRDDGARSALRVFATPPPPPAEKPAPRTTAIEVKGDFAAGSFAVGDEALSPLLLQIDAAVAGNAPSDTPNLLTLDGALAVPLELELHTPAGLVATGWAVEIADVTGAVVHRAEGDGAPPARHEWDGTTDGAPALQSGVLYEYVFSVSSADGRGVSPSRAFSVDIEPVGIEGTHRAGALFKGASELTATFKNHLSKIVTILGKRPADERWTVSISTIPSAGATESDAVVELAARRAKTKKYLIRLGLDEARFEVDITQGTRRDTVDVFPAAPPDEVDIQQVFAEVAGAVQAIEAGTFTTSVEVSGGAPVTVVLGAPSGGFAEYVVIPIVEMAEPASAPTPSPTESVHAEPAPAAAAVAAGDFVVHLPPQGTLLRARQLGVSGKTRAYNRVFIGGDLPTEVAVHADGTFSAVVELPVGRSDLVIQTIDLAGNKAVLTWPVNVDQRYLFAMAMVEGIASTSYTERGFFADTSVLDGMTEDSTVSVGPFVVHGRAVGYVKARVPGGPIASYLEVTGHVDTAAVQGQGAFFEDVMNPERDFAVFGDSGEQVRDVNTRGKLYLRVEGGESSAVVGAIHTDLDEELVRYDRTVNGAMVDFQKDLSEKHRVEVRAFGTTGGDGLRRDVNWYRATGGSLYYMRHGSVSEGSERVRVVVRERDSGMVVSESVLERNVDYTVDYVGGRILLIEPIASTSRSEWLLDNFDHATAPFDGHPVYLEVRYEHSDQTGDGEATGGAFARYETQIRDGTVHISAGVGAVREDRAGEDYSLAGGDIRVTVGTDSTFVVSGAGSQRANASNLLSQDGGMTFLDLDQVAAVAGETTGYATSIRMDINAGEVLGAGKSGRDASYLDKLRLQAYRHAVDRGFSAGGSALDEGHDKYGLLATYTLSETDTIAFRFETDLAYVPRVGPTRDDVDANGDPAAFDERGVERATLQWGRSADRWTHRAELGFAAVSSTAALADGSAQQEARRLGAGVGTAYAYNTRLTLRAAQRGFLGLSDADPQLDPIVLGDSSRRDSDPLAGITSNVGADLLLTGDVMLAADWYQRWNGDNAGQIGLRSELSDTGSMYVRQRAESREGDFVSTTVIGADDQVANLPGSRTYGEYQIENGALGNRNRAVLGLGHRWQAQRGLRVSVGFEHQQVFGGFLPDGTPVGDQQRNVVYGGVDFTRIERFKAAASIELRVDNAAGTSAINDLIRDDPRDIADPGGFGDHGGVAPGAPLLLAPGERIQVVGGAGATYAVAPDHTLLAQFRIAHSTVDEGTGVDEYTAAHYRRLTAGWAFRPLDHDWFAVLARYSYVTDQRPVTSAMDSMDARSHVAAIVPIVDLPHHLTIAGKLAFKRTEAISLLGGDETDLSADSILWLLRLGYGFYGHWDASVELRQLYIAKPEANESRVGTLIELGYDLGNRIRLGVGYNFSHFSDNELGDLVRDSHGMFMRVTGHY